MAAELPYFVEADGSLPADTPVSAVVTDIQKISHCIHEVNMRGQAGSDLVKNSDCTESLSGSIINR